MSDGIKELAPDGSRSQGRGELSAHRRLSYPVPVRVAEPLAPRYPETIVVRAVFQ